MEYIKRGHMSGHLRLTVPFLMINLFLSSPLVCQDTIPEILVTVSSKNKTINQILDEITLQTGYRFTYNAELINGKQRVQFQVVDQPLDLALDSLFSNPRLDYRKIDRNIVIYQKNTSPSSQISNEIDRSLLKGRVVDSHSGKPLPFATIALYGTSQGSISNQEGEFTFKIPGNLADPLLVISYMGYKNRYLSVDTPVTQNVNVLLEKETIPLQEVIIRYADPEMILREALNNIPRNYLDEYATMTAFYRESVRRNDHCMVYSEAVLDVAKGPYLKNSASDRVKIRKARKITDITSEDTVLVKLRSGIYNSLSLDVIKNRPDFLADDLLDRYTLEFTDMMTYGDRLVYVISFQKKSFIPDLLFRGQLYIDQENLAVLAADFEFPPELIHKEPGLFLVSRSPKIHIRPMMARYHVDYRALNGKYYISQVRGELEMKVRKRQKWFGASYRITIEMAITDIIPGQRLHINMAERVNPNIILTDQPFEFDPAFWGIYNTIEPEVSLMESIQRLEHNLQEINE